MLGRETTIVAVAACMALIVLTPVAGGTSASRKPGGIPNAAGVYAGSVCGTTR